MTAPQLFRKASAVEYGVRLYNVACVDEAPVIDDYDYILNKVNTMNDALAPACNFPGGDLRLIHKPMGLRYTFMNDVATSMMRTAPDPSPGKLLRSTEGAA